MTALYRETTMQIRSALVFSALAIVLACVVAALFADREARETDELIEHCVALLAQQRVEATP